VKSVWPTKVDKDASRVSLEYLLSRAPRLWSSTAECFSLPGMDTITYINRLTQTITDCIPEWRVLTQADSSQLPASSILMGGMKRVRSCKFFTALRVSAVVPKRRLNSRIFISLDVFLIQLHRYAKPKGAASRSLRLKAAHSSHERDCIGIDQLGSYSRLSLYPEKLIFDFAASISESSAYSLTVEIDSKDVFQPVYHLSKRYSLRQQELMLKSNYKVFEVPLNLKSYNNRLIDTINGHRLFNFLMVDKSRRNLYSSGGNSLLLRQELTVKGTCSLCFLSMEHNASDRMKLTILCRSQGRTIREFMFREGCMLAFTIANNIAIEAAGLILNELKFAAQQLRRDDLWSIFATTDNRNHSRGSEEILGLEMKELLTYCTVQSLWPIINGNAQASLLFSHLQYVRAGDSWIDDLLKSSSCFHYLVSVDNVDECKRLFFVREENCFLMVSHTSQSFDLSLVEHGDIAHERKESIVKKLTNFLLHSTWLSM
jgi:hypothetical protein